MKVNGFSDEIGRLKLEDLTCISGQQKLADSPAQGRVLAVKRPDEAVSGTWLLALSR